MTSGTIVYLFLLLAGLVISIFYLQYGAVALLGLLLTVPFFMFFFLIVMRKCVSVSVDSKNPLSEKDELEKPARAVVTLTVENRNRILPLTKGIARVRYENTFSGDKGKLKIRFSVDAGKKRDRRIPVVMDNCGNVAITVEKVRIYDYLNILESLSLSLLCSSKQKQRVYSYCMAICSNKDKYLPCIYEAAELT